MLAKARNFIVYLSRAGLSCLRTKHPQIFEHFRNQVVRVIRKTCQRMSIGGDHTCDGTGAAAEDEARCLFARGEELAKVVTSVADELVKVAGSVTDELVKVVAGGAEED